MKTANLLMDPEGHPLVIDFGLAKEVEADVGFTASGPILGTPGYVCPTGHRPTRIALSDAVARMFRYSASLLETDPQELKFYLEQRKVFQVRAQTRIPRG